MSTVLFIKRKITAAQNITKTTRAMQMIAASKLKRCQNQALAARPYAEKLMQILESIVPKLDEKNYHDYMKTQTRAKNNLLIVISPDKGLCGGLIGNIYSKALDYDSENKDAFYLTIGKKIEKYLSILNKKVIASFKFGTTLPPYEMVFPIITIINDYFLGRKVSSVKILYSKSINVFIQKQIIINLLPIQLSPSPTKSVTLFEPKPEILLPPLLKHYLETEIYHCLLEAYASEQSARMIAMQNATDNATQITNELKLEYNVLRQEKITNEILDIGSSTFAYSYES